MTSILFGDFETKLDLDGDGTSIQRNIQEAMHKKSSKKVFLVYGPDCAFETSVSTDMSEDTITWELGLRARRSEILPRKSIVPLRWPKLTGATLVVSAGSHLYCIGGELESALPCNKVFKLDRNNLQGRLEECDKMLQARAYPAVVSLGGKIYVFGGLAPSKVGSSPWAEFLDTTKPKEEQEWKALKDPKFPRSCSKLGCTQLFAFPYDDQTIFIGCGILPNKDAVLYNVADNSWSRYGCFPKFPSWFFAARPDVLVSDKTIYWIDGNNFKAYDFDKRVYFHYPLPDGDGEDGLFSYYNPKNYAANVPRMVHLEDNLFGFFGSFYDFNQLIQIVEFTKVRITKKYFTNIQGLQGYLKLSIVGFQSYRCEQYSLKLSAVVSM